MTMRGKYTIKMAWREEILLKTIRIKSHCKEENSENGRQRTLKDGFGTVHSIYTKNCLRGPKDLKTTNIKPKGSKRRLKKVKIIHQDEKIGHGRVMCKNHSSSVIS